MTDEDLTYKLLTGEIVKNHEGTFYFSQPGNWIDGKYLIWAKLHRIDGPAIDLYDGSKEWWLNGNPHRLDGPAVEYGNGTKEWWQYGKLHRTDGPAVERFDGSKRWYLNYEEFTEEEFNQIIKQKQRESLCDRSRRLLIFDPRSQ